jgi:predicted transcriptional regulator
MGTNPNPMSRRERQVMDVLYKKGRATAYEVMDALPEPATYSAVRVTLATLERKGHLRHEKDGPKYVFIPNTSAGKVKRSALRHLLRTFFGDSREQFLAALLDASPSEISDDDLDRLAGLVDKARKGRKR